MPTPEDRAAGRAQGTIGALIPSWLRSLRAGDKSNQTCKVYVEGAAQLDEFLDSRPARTATEVTRADIEDWIISLRDRGMSPATVSSRYRAVQQFFAWCVDEEEIDRSPTERMKSPTVPERPVPVVGEEDIRTLLASLNGRTFKDRRDAAAVRLFLDTGLRRSELASITVDDVDLDGRVVTVVGKGRRPRMVRYGAKTAVAMDRYSRARAKERTAALPAWWLAESGRGPMTADGVYQMIVRRAKTVGLDVHPHQLRHSWAHYFLAAGGNETDLMHNAGWRSRQMLTRYARSTAEERARESAGRLALGDRL
ncbi:Integrase family protein [Frankia sp. Hr75.2]|nr:Integrase family protein [Frankia sp. Hr75.2]